MDREAAREFRDRWQAVAAVEIEEQRAASLSDRWRELLSILRFAKTAGLQVPDPDVDEDAWLRWAELRDRCTTGHARALG